MAPFWWPLLQSGLCEEGMSMERPMFLSTLLLYPFEQGKKFSQRWIHTSILMYAPSGVECDYCGNVIWQLPLSVFYILYFLIINKLFLKPIHWEVLIDILQSHQGANYCKDLDMFREMEDDVWIET